MLKSAISVALLASILGVAGCASRAQTVGTAGGAAVGYGVTGGSAIGTVAGGVVGNQAGKEYDRRHR